MSQAKVDRYKKEKANRKQIMRKQKMMNFARKAVLSLAALALIGWLGYSAWDMYESGKERLRMRRLSNNRRKMGQVFTTDYTD